ncbi:hypothetical protein B0H14DRAFT_2758159 [Mycena olivaceomarginata]|nr:hypothetical protein B0H14DRAFT_2758159 [Mycena olivaceomarginata]
MARTSKNPRKDPQQSRTPRRPANIEFAYPRYKKHDAYISRWLVQTAKVHGIPIVASPNSKYPILIKEHLTLSRILIKLGVQPPSTLETRLNAIIKLRTRCWKWHQKATPKHPSNRTHLAFIGTMRQLRELWFYTPRAYDTSDSEWEPASALQLVSEPEDIDIDEVGSLADWNQPDNDRTLYHQSTTPPDETLLQTNSYSAGEMWTRSFAYPTYRTYLRQNDDRGHAEEEHTMEFMQPTFLAGSELWFPIPATKKASRHRRMLDEEGNLVGTEVASAHQPFSYEEETRATGRDEEAISASSRSRSTYLYFCLDASRSAGRTEGRMESGPRTFAPKDTGLDPDIGSDEEETIANLESEDNVGERSSICSSRYGTYSRHNDDRAPPVQPFSGEETSQSGSNQQTWSDEEEDIAESDCFTSRNRATFSRLAADEGQIMEPYQPHFAGESTGVHLNTYYDYEGRVTELAQGADDGVDSDAESGSGRERNWRMLATGSSMGSSRLHWTKMSGYIAEWDRYTYPGDGNNCMDWGGREDDGGCTGSSQDRGSEQDASFRDSTQHARNDASYACLYRVGSEVHSRYDMDAAGEEANRYYDGEEDDGRSDLYDPGSADEDCMVDSDQHAGEDQDSGPGFHNVGETTQYADYPDNMQRASRIRYNKDAGSDDENVAEWGCYTYPSRDTRADWDGVDPDDGVYDPGSRFGDEDYMVEHAGSDRDSCAGSDYSERGESIAESSQMETSRGGGYHTCAEMDGVGEDDDGQVQLQFGLLTIKNACQIQATILATTEVASTPTGTWFLNMAKTFAGSSNSSSGSNDQECMSDSGDDSGDDGSRVCSNRDMVSGYGESVAGSNQPPHLYRLGSYGDIDTAIELNQSISGEEDRTGSNISSRQHTGSDEDISSDGEENMAELDLPTAEDNGIPHSCCDNIGFREHRNLAGLVHPYSDENLEDVEEED